jgi:hypothetical protein
LHKAYEMPEEKVKQEVEKSNRARNRSLGDCLLLYKSRMPVVEQAIESAALMLEMDKSRDHCLEMIRADVLARANLDNENPEVLLQSALRFFKFLPGEVRQKFVHRVTEKAS